jgi:hypothetical protein
LARAHSLPDLQPPWMWKFRHTACSVPLNLGASL